MKQSKLLSSLVFAGLAASASAAVVFMDDFSTGYTIPDGQTQIDNTTPDRAAVVEGQMLAKGWTAITTTGNAEYGILDKGHLYGHSRGETLAFEYNYYSPTLAAGDTLSIDVITARNNPYNAAIILWDGADEGTRVVAGSWEGSSANGEVLSYTLQAGDASHVIFQYGHGANWGETDSVAFNVIPETSTALLGGLGLLALLRRRK